MDLTEISKDPEYDRTTVITPQIPENNQKARDKDEKYPEGARKCPFRNRTACCLNTNVSKAHRAVT